MTIVRIAGVAGVGGGVTEGVGSLESAEMAEGGDKLLTGEERFSLAGVGNASGLTTSLLSSL